jgi:hypothetical protein
MTLAEQIKQVMELDAKRTQGVLVHRTDKHVGDIYVGEGDNHWFARCFADKKYDAPDGKFYNDALEGAASKSAAEKQIKANAAFVVSTPLMASIIRQLTDVVKVQHEALVEGKHYTFLAEHHQDESNFPELADKALALSAPIVKVGG